MRPDKHFLSIACIVMLFAWDAGAAEFFRKQSGTTSFTGTSTTVAIPITLDDMSKSILVFSSTINNNGTTNFQIGGEIVDANTLSFVRTGNTGTVFISWQIFEFESGVYVQHGSTTNIARGTPVNVAITCVDLTKSFVLISARKSGGQYGADDGISANLTASTNLQFFISSNGPGGADMEEAYWQVIEYQGAIVKKLVTTLSAGSTSTTSTISPAITNLSKAFVVSNHWLDGDINSDDLPRTELTNTTTVTYTRVGTTANMNFVTYVIEFTDGSTVTRGVQNFGTGVVTQPVSITSSISSGVFGSGNFGRQGSTDFATDDNPGHNWFTYEITSSTNLQITRAVGTGSTANAPWQIVTFEDTGLQQNTFYSLATGDWESSSSWSFTPDGSSGAVPAGVYPRRTNNVVIQNGHTITVNSVTDNNPCSQSPDGLGLGNVGTFTGSGDQMFYHTGDIIIANGGTLTATEEVMLGGYTLVENGGTFTIAEDIINLGYLEVSSAATFSNTDDLILSGNSITIINSLSFGADDIYLDWTDATLCGDGIMNLGNGGPDPTVQFFNGGTLAQICSTFSLTCTSNCGAFPINGTGNFSSGIVGPGGVGNANDNSIWLMANVGTSTAVNGTPVSAWNDQSGNSNHAGQASSSLQPLFQTSIINGQPALLFDNVTGTNSDILTVPDNDNLDGTSGLSILTITRPNNLNGNPRAILSKRVGFNSQASYTLFYFSGNRLSVDVDLGNNRFQSVATFSNSTNYITNLFYDGTLAAASRSRLYINGNLDITATESSATIPNYASDLSIGLLNAADGRPFGGHIAEVIIYRRTLNEAERIIADNYLSAKYNISLSANDVYTMDNPGNGDYDFEVAGIGQTTASVNHRDAKGSGIVRMWNPSALNDNDFLIWGHDNGALTNSADVDGVVIEERFTRIWAVSETADVGTVRVSFDFNGIGNPLGSNLRLLIDRDMDFSTNDVTPIVGTVSGNIVVFSGVNFQDGDRFTLGNTDATIPLPITLTEFNATPASNHVILTWTTESEVNNDFFTIERSTDAELWDRIADVEGAGTSHELRKYQTFDLSPIIGRSYYRLKQTDFDGKYDYSKIVSVNYEGASPIVISPNPSSGIFYFESTDLRAEQIRVFNIHGQQLEIHSTLKNNRHSIDLTNFPSGIYIVRVANGTLMNSIRVIKL